MCVDLTDAQRLKLKEFVKLRNEKNGKLIEEDKGKKYWAIRDNELVLFKKPTNKNQQNFFSVFNKGVSKKEKKQKKEKTG